MDKFYLLKPRIPEILKPKPIRAHSSLIDFEIRTMRKILLILILLAACVFPERTFAQVVLKTDTIEVPCGAPTAFLVPIRVRDFTDIAGLQFTFQWNPAQLDYAYITDINPAFDAIGFDSTSLISQGKFTFSWTQLNSLTLPDDEVLLNVAFTRIGGPATPLDFVQDPTAIFVFNGNFEEVPYSLAPGLVKPLDTAPPTITCPANVVAQGVGPTAVNNIAPASAADDCGTPVIGWTSTGATVASFPNDPDASGALFNIGSSTVTYTATDVVGNTSTCSFMVSVEFAIGDDLTFLTEIPAASCGQQVSINVTAYNFDTIAAFQYSMGWNPALLQYVSVTNLNPDLALTPANFGTTMTGQGQFSIAWDGPFTGTTLPDGAVVFTLNFNVLGTANLTFGDVPTASFAFSGATFPPEEVPMVLVDGIITVIDNVAPSITCPANVTVQAPGSIAVQNIAPATVADNCAAPTVGWSSTGATLADFPSDADASGALFNQGNSTVTYTATDAGGNTATCSFNVTVEFGAGSTDLTIVANSATASCGGSFFIDVTTLNFDTIAGLQFSMGWDPALIQYTSVSNFNPALSLVQANFGEGFANNGQLTFSWTGPLSGTDLVDGAVLFRVNFNLLGSTGTTFNFGNVPTDILAFQGPDFPPTDIPVTTFDGQVTILDNVPPTITCPANVTVDAPSGSLTATVNNLQPTALADNCGGNPTLTYSQSGATTGSGSGNANGDYSAGTTNVTYTATDAAGNTATCSFTVVVNADAPLVLHLDTLETDCQGAGGTVKYCITVDNFTDIIGLQFGLQWDTAVLQLLPPANMAYPGLTLNNGMFFNYSTKDDGLLLFFGSILTWPDIPTGDTLFCLNFSVQDPPGTTALAFQGPFNGVNTSFAAVPVTATDGLFSAAGDNTPPVVTCPANETVSPIGTECNATYLPPMPTAVDACGSVASITHVPVSNIFGGGTTTITYTVTDQAGNSATCSFDLTVTDANPPQIFDCPANITVNAAANDCSAAVNWNEPVFNDCSTVTVTNNFFPGDMFPVSACTPTTVKYEASDFFGNSATCTFNVLVLDVTNPTITCPADIVLFPVNSCDTVLTLIVPVATDACDQDLDIAPDVPLTSSYPPGTTTVTWVALDDCSNVGECTFNITVVDGAPPTLTGCPANITEVSNSNNCGANVNWTAPTATDDCDALVSLTSTPFDPGSFFIVGQPATITYTATDDSGNFTTCTFTVTVLDETVPALINCPTAPIIVLLPGSDCDTTLNWVAPTASDNCGQFTLVSNFMPGASFGTGDTMVTYIVTDASGNADTCSFLVSVRDQVPPVLSNCPSNITVNGNGACKVPATWIEPTATDNCSVPKITTPFSPNDSFMVGNTIVQIIAEDASQNYDTCTFTVTVLGVPPGFDLTTLPANVSVSACDTLISWTLPSAIGFCNPATVTSDPPSPTNFGPGMHVVTFTATDGATTVTATFVITVVEDVDPILLCPSTAIEVNTGGIITDGAGFITATDTVAGCNAVELTFALPTATDNCVVPEVTQMTGITSGGVFAVGPHTLTFVATDAAGNTAECSVNINVSPLTALNPTADPNPGCLNETVVITAPAIQGAVYAWVKLPSTVLQTTGNEYTISSLTPQTAGLYAVLANVNGCLTPLDSIEITLITAPAPLNDVFEIEAGALDTFNVFTNDGLSNPADYEICATSPDPLPTGITPLGNGLFAFQEQTGKSVSFAYQICYCGEPGEMATVTITVKNIDCTYIPNIITPNGDGLNDWLIIKCLDGRNYPDNSIVIYNQWGDQVFEDKGYTNDPNDPSHPAWRGTLKGESGKDLPDGVYFYIFKPGPSEKPIKGFVEVFR